MTAQQWFINCAVVSGRFCRSDVTEMVASRALVPVYQLANGAVTKRRTGRPPIGRLVDVKGKKVLVEMDAAAIDPEAE